MKKHLTNVNNLLWLALVLALAGSIKHLATIFASIDGNLFMGWLQAIAIDTGLFALAYSIKVRKMADRSVKPIWFGVVIFTVISVYGNLAYGLFAINGVLPWWITVSKPVVLAASLPILVLFLSELLSDDRQHAKYMTAENVAMSFESPDIVTTPNQTVTQLSENGQDKDGKMTQNGRAPKADKEPNGKLAKRRRRVKQLLSEGMAAPGIAAELNVSERTAARDMAAVRDGINNG